MVGYTGGSNPSPTYQSVCHGDGHTEALQVHFDTEKMSYKDVLDVYYQQMSGGKERSKVQYKNAIWVHTEEQRAVAKEGADARRVQLDIEDAKPWHDAEEYHQKYFARKSR
eukprot:NODE_12703_length_1208_cov_9.185939.p3 GENE.NODE_12703_length_1208_cov_9.185939~~NODE_12703_length_1208_cov_9.185939.p3  ORF type:complete len:111 (+),score=31.16 NODE_12703_length_1208_cov_9.185939:261-593(+)